MEIRNKRELQHIAFNHSSDIVSTLEILWIFTTNLLQNHIYFKRLTRNFLGQRSFLGIRHFDKHSPTTQERKAPQGKNLRFFRLETLKNCILNENFTHRWPQSGHFFPQIRALFSNFWKRAGETYHPPASSYAPVMYKLMFHQSHEIVIMTATYQCEIFPF